MYKYLALTALVITAQHAAFAQDPLPVHESFDYAELSPLNWAGGPDGQVWQSEWIRANGDDVVMGRGSLGSGGDFEGNHLAVDFQQVGLRYNRRISDIPDEGQTLWAAYIMDIKPGANANNVANITLTWSGSQVFTFGKKYGNQKFGMVWPGATQYNSEVDVEGLHWVVARIDFSGDAGTEQAWLWIDPDPQSEPDPADAVLAVPQSGQPQLIIPGINGVQIKAEGNPPLRMDMDEIRLGSSFADVNPYLTTSIQKVGASTAFRVFPNPASAQLTVQLSETDHDFEVAQLFSFDGKLLARWDDTSIPSGQTFFRLDLRGLGLIPGTYILQLIGNAGSSNQKVVIQ